MLPCLLGQRTNCKPSCFKAISWQLLEQIEVIELLLLYTRSTKKFFQAESINRAGKTLFIIRIDWHEIKYPVRSSFLSDPKGWEEMRSV